MIDTTHNDLDIESLKAIHSEMAGFRDLLIGEMSSISEVEFDLEKKNKVMATLSKILSVVHQGAKITKYSTNVNQPTADVKMKKTVTSSIPNNLNVHNYYSLSEDINILRDSLRDNHFIDSIRLNKFSSIFSDKNIEKPIRWIGTQAELSYFVKSIKPWLVTEKSYLIRAGNIFVDANGGLFNNIGNPKSAIPLENERILHNIVSMFIQGLEEARRKKPFKH